MIYSLIRMRNIFFAAALALSFSICAHGQAKPTKTLPKADKIGGFLKKSGYEYKEFKKGLWTVESESGPILIGEGDDFVVIFMIVAKNGKFKITGESMRDMLKLGGDLDYVEFAIDDNGDLAARADTKVKLLDQAVFEDLLVRVHDGYEKALAKLTPYLIK